jgi:hypothetical protein
MPTLPVFTSDVRVNALPLPTLMLYARSPPSVWTISVPPALMVTVPVPSANGWAMVTVPPAIVVPPL